MDASHFNTMPQPKLARVATALMEEVVALKGLVGKQSPVAKVYAELDAAHQAERDMLRRAVRPLNVWKFCHESTEYSALKSMGGKRSDCAAVMCGVASLLGDIGVCMPPMAMGRAGALMYKVPDPVLFIDLCGEEESTDDEDELPIASSVTATEENESQDMKETVQKAEASAVPELWTVYPRGGEKLVELGLLSRAELANYANGSETLVRVKIAENLQRDDPLPSGTHNAVDELDRNGAMWRLLGHAGGGTVNGETYTHVECYEKAIEINSKDSSAWSNLGIQGGGRVNGKSFSTVECMVQFLESCDSNDDDYVDSDNYNLSASAAWSAIAFKGEGGRVSGTYYNASECLTKAIEHQPNDLPDEPAKGAFYAMWKKLGHLGGARVDGEDYTPAQCFAKALEMKSDEFNGWYSLGKAGGGLVSGQNYTPAQCFGRALEIDPLSCAAWQLLADVGGGGVLGRTYSAADCKGKAQQTLLMEFLPKKK